MTEGARILSNPDELKGKTDDMANMQEVDMQTALQKTQQDIDQLGDIMKEIYDTEESVIRNMKP